jgi:hypothetical protein
MIYHSVKYLPQAVAACKESRAQPALSTAADLTLTLSRAVSADGRDSDWPAPVAHRLFTENGWSDFCNYLVERWFALDEDRRPN